LSAAAVGYAASAVTAEAWSSPTVFVNGSELSGYGHGGCSEAQYTTISAAAAAAPGTRIVVCPGTYHEGVLIDKQLKLIGRDAVIDASSSPFGNGVQI